MTSKSVTLNNLNGEFNQIQISTKPQINLLDYMTLVKVYNLKPDGLNNLLEGEYFSTVLIMESNQIQTTIFQVPLLAFSNYKIEVTIVSEIDKDLVEEIQIVPVL
ncbi:MAG: hypothetical protein QM725_01495 [Lacibacter sp.]